ncbi:MAG: hypothetical protein NTW59_03225 [Candidatus Diapherotrites archaeon]|nr:hypothetical protein [Candidatus Diapherotrites archaeon]
MKNSHQRIQGKQRGGSAAGGRAPGSEEQGLSIIVRNVAAVIAVPAIIFGLYVILHGHLTPGGGFAGGAIIATFFALLAISFGGSKTEGALRRGILVNAESIGLVGFALCGFIGIGATFFYNSLAHGGPVFGTPVPFGVNAGWLNTAGVLPLMNFAVGFEVTAALSLVVLVMLAHPKADFLEASLQSKALRRLANQRVCKVSNRKKAQPKGEKA